VTDDGQFVFQSGQPRWGRGGEPGCWSPGVTVGQGPTRDEPAQVSRESGTESPMATSVCLAFPPAGRCKET